jgi:twin arginine-targeting protein translocase TatB
MFLFIFESIGTQELLLIGIVALIFLGPRRMPEMARKLGKIMSDFKNTTSEFKSTWEREVNFEKDAKDLRSVFDDEESAKPVARENSILPEKTNGEIVVPEVRQVDPGLFDNIDNPIETKTPSEITQPVSPTAAADPNAKENWL